jgi:hypothetical protein
MTNRFLTLTFAACMASSLAFADNPTDAPLMFDDGNAAAVQKDAQKNIQKESRTYKRQRHTYKKEEQQTIRVKNTAPSKSNSRQGN